MLIVMIEINWVSYISSLTVSRFNLVQGNFKKYSFPGPIQKNFNSIALEYGLGILPVI